MAVILNLRIVDEYPSGVADSASQLKRKYLLALRLRPLGPLDWRQDCTVTRGEPWQGGLSEDHQEGRKEGLEVRRLVRLTVTRGATRQGRQD